MLTNIKLAQKGLSGTNTLAYYEHLYVIELGPRKMTSGAFVIKIVAIIYKWAKSAEWVFLSGMP